MALDRVARFLEGLEIRTQEAKAPPPMTCQRVGCGAPATRFAMLDFKIWLCSICFAAIATGCFTVGDAPVDLLPKPVDLIPKSVSIKPVDPTRSEKMKEGFRLAAIAGKPSKQQIIQVYGPKGPSMTWIQRAASGIPAEKFQEALRAKQSASSAGA